MSPIYDVAYSINKGVQVAVEDGTDQAILDALVRLERWYPEDSFTINSVEESNG